MESADLQDLKRRYSESITAVTTLMAKVITDEIEKTISESSLPTKIMLKIGGKKLEEEATIYISSIIVLAFEMKPVNKESIGRIISAAGLSPNQRLVDFAASIQIAELLPYIPTAYLLKVNGLDVTEEEMVKVLSSINIKANREAASKVLIKYKEKEASTGKAPESGSIHEKIENSIEDVAKMVSRLTNMELDRTFERKDTISYIKDLIPYLTATAELALLGKDLGQTDSNAFKANVRAIVEALGIKPDEKMMEFVTNLNYGNALMYVPPLFFLLSINSVPNSEKIGNIAMAMGIPKDDAQAGYVLTIYQDIKTSF